MRMPAYGLGCQSMPPLRDVVARVHFHARRHKKINLNPKYGIGYFMEVID